MTGCHPDYVPHALVFDMRNGDGSPIAAAEYIHITPARQERVMLVESGSIAVYTVVLLRPSIL